MKLEPPKKHKSFAPAIAQERPPLAPETILAPTRFVAHGSSALCDGRRSIEVIARDGGIAIATAIELCTSLYAEAAVEDVDPTQDTPIAPLLFLEHVRALCLRARRAALEQRPALDALFESGAYSARQASGYLFEVTCFIRSAPTHIACAIASAEDEALRLALSEYLAEEYWHGDWMRRGLEIEHAKPLPETQAVIDAWQHAARTDLLLYGGLIAITESNENESAEIEALFERTVAQKILPEDAWRPYFEHAYGDSGADHLAYCQAIYARAEPLDRARRHVLRDRLLTHTNAVLSMEHAIIDFYA